MSFATLNYIEKILVKVGYLFISGIVWISLKKIVCKVCFHSNNHKLKLLVLTAALWRTVCETGKRVSLKLENAKNILIQVWNILTETFWLNNHPQGRTLGPPLSRYYSDYYCPFKRIVDEMSWWSDIETKGQVCGFADKLFARRCPASRLSDLRWLSQIKICVSSKIRGDFKKVSSRVIDVDLKKPFGCIRHVALRRRPFFSFRHREENRLMDCLCNL